MQNVEDTIQLNLFQPREYQKPVFDLIFNRKCRRIILCWARRGGKDFTLWNAAIRQCLMKPCSVMYAGETYGSIRKIIWNALDNDGKRFLDYIPPRLISKINESEMRITFINNSILQCIGADSHKTSLRGTNPSMVILSEFAYYSDPTVLDTVTPILAANEGVLVIASTPQGKNSFYTLWKMAQELPDWWTDFRTIEDMHHIKPEELEFERKRMNPEKFLQEYYCSFQHGVDGSIFGKALHLLERDGHITSVSWEPGLLVHLSIDIGLSKGNATTMIWFQVVGDGTIIRLIDCFSTINQGLDFFAAKIQEKKDIGWKLGVLLAPHDLKVREWGAGAVTRYEKARQLDVEFTILDQHLLVDQIENALTHFPKVWIDAVKCKALLDALENYYREWDEQRQVYKPKPVHNWAADYASAFMGIFLGLHHTQSGKSGDEYMRIRNKALYGGQNNLPRIFRDGMNN